MNCKKGCNRRLQCGHSCTELCFLPCKSDCACEKDFDHVVALTESSEKTHAAPLDYAKARSPHNTQPYRDFATGGHVESDRNLAALLQREAAEAQGKQLDKENFAALFSNSEGAVPVDETKKMTLVRRMPDGKGGSRGVWKEAFGGSPSKKEEASLLDL